MKYLPILFILMPVMCQATMSAKDAHNRADQANKDRQNTANTIFEQDVNLAIENAVQVGNCGTGVASNSVSNDFFLKVIQKLKSLGYDVSVDGPKSLVISWCKE